MNLNAMANASTQAVNPNIMIRLYKWIGQDNTGTFAKAMYSEAGEAYAANAQPVSPSEVQYIDGYEAVKIYRDFYINFNTQGMSPILQTGKDKIKAEGEVYLIVKVWDDFRTGWVKVTGVLIDA